MSAIGPAAASGTAPAATSQDARLRRTVHDLEGVFVTRLLQAMRDTVPKDGLTEGGTGEEMFTTMFDEHVAAAAPAQWHHGIGEALYRQLRAKANLQDPHTGGSSDAAHGS
jgi:Rod binding domain-containing protein